MSLIAFDTLRAAKLLRDAGVEERQAEAFVQIMQQTADLPPIDHLATKADLGILKTDIENSIAGLRSEMENLRVETRADIRVLAAQTVAQKAELIWWVIGAGAIGVITQAGLKLLHLG
jgi:hypothetical protein